MNEFGILMSLLTQMNSKKGITVQGASTEEIGQALGYHGKYKRIQTLEKLTEFSQAIKTFGLCLSQNPMNAKWFLKIKSDNANYIKKNMFQDKPKLGATLCVIIALTFIFNKSLTIDQIKTYRKKKGVLDDLTELEKINLIEIKDNKVNLSENCGFFINFREFEQLIHDIM